LTSESYYGLMKPVVASRLTSGIQDDLHQIRLNYFRKTTECFAWAYEKTRIKHVKTSKN
jgi:hypothetical protein